jgi:uncharacterized protein
VRVAELWRYPVKSLGGERLERAAIEPGGIEGDRRWALFDLETGYGLTARRVPELLFASARLGGGGEVEIHDPSGRRLGGDEQLSEWLGRRVVLRAAAAGGPRRYENPRDAEEERDWREYRGASGPFHDSARARLTLVSRQSLGEWDRRRFRANVILAGGGEDELVGERVALGASVVEIRKRISRCVMITRPQPGGIERDPGVLRTVARERRNRLAVGATVERPGLVAVGAELRPLGPGRS